ncbi:MAG: ABC transporter ATP-binding protein [Flavobacteriales bacterium]|nr:ABC transporter ATP-binding protein [Flavobacteriales bacterium]
MQSKSILSIQNLSITFRQGKEWNQVIKGVSLEVPQGGILGVVGESGSGKTVSSLACLGLLPSKIARIDHGVALFGASQEDLLKDNFSNAKRYRGKEITMIFQEPMSSLNPSMTCGAQVAEMLKEHLGMDAKKARQRTVELFTEVELPVPDDMFDSYPHELSGGQKQRVMIAMALAPEPSLIFADEPTTALDVTVQKSVLELLRRLQQARQLSMIFISHDLGVVAHVADQVAVMYKGEVLESGPVTQVMENPTQAYTKGLLACVPPTGGERVRLQTVEEIIKGGEMKKEIYSSSPSEDPILRVKNLWKRFVTKRNLLGKATDHFEAVRGVSFELFQGETLGIVGESGCGKSTISRMIIGLIEPSEGSIEWSGSAGAVQLVFQDPYSSLNPRISVGTALVEAMMVNEVESDKQKAQDQVRSILAEVGLDPSHFDRYPHSFSGGQRQRIVVARALCTKPRVVVLDESVAALDVSVQAQVLNLLNELKASRGLTYVFISHDLHVVHYMSDRLLVMERGQIVESGNAHKIFTQPSEEYTKKLVESAVLTSEG